MMGPGEVIIALIVIGLPIIALSRDLAAAGSGSRSGGWSSKPILAAEKAAQYAASNAELEARVRVLEKIVTDGGLETAAQIEALRTPRLTKGDKVQ